MKINTLITLLLTSTLALCQTNSFKLSKTVNPFIGTGGHGHTYPGASSPFGMVQLSPDTRKDGWDGCGGYHYSDDEIYGFSHTHLSGTGVSDYGDLLILPEADEQVVIDNFETEENTAKIKKVQLYKNTEKAYAGYYECEFGDARTKAQLTSSLHTGFHKYSFKRKGNHYLSLDLDYRDKLKDVFFEKVNDSTLRGKRISKAWAEEQHFYFYLHSSQKIKSCTKIESSNRYKITFNNAFSELELAVSISAVDLKGAENNFKREFKTFKEAYTQNITLWEKELNKIQIKSLKKDQDTIFYTALYHSFLNPNTFSDVDGRYRGTDNQIHYLKSGEQYTVFSLWDTFRATHPLFALTQREKTREFIHTFLRQYKEGGKLPMWELAGNYTGCMIGYHAVPVIVDAYNKGIKDFNYQLALEAMISTAKADELGKTIYRNNAVLEQGDEPESVSKQLEYAYNDWCIAIFADSLGNKEVANEFYKRSLTYRNCYNPENKFMQPRVNGAFASNFIPNEVTFNYTEANAWQYSLFTPHDIEGLTKLLGGKNELEAWLDRLFTTKSDLEGRHQVDITGLIGQYAHGNEPSHHMAYLYNYTNNPNKTNYYTNKILTEQYWNGADGLSGNEDCGQMSSWYVLSALGLYAVTPGSSYYDISSPLVESATLNLENGKQFKIVSHNKSKENIYVQSIKVNGEKHNKSYLNFKTINNGGTIEYTFSNKPLVKASKLQHPVSKVTFSKFTTIPAFSTDQRSFTAPFLLNIKNPDNDKIMYRFVSSEKELAAFKEFKKRLKIKKNTSIEAYAVSNNTKSAIIKADYNKINNNLSINLKTAYANQYNGGNKNALIDGATGSNNYKTGVFQGFQKNDVEFVLNFKKTQKIKGIRLGMLRDINAWIFIPKEVKVEYFNKKGESIANSTSTFTEYNSEENYYNNKKVFAVSKINGKVHSIKVKIKNAGPCPEWHLGAGGDTWIFLDEVEILY